MKALLITNDFPPMTGGEATWYAQICDAVPAGRVVVLAPRVRGDRAFDAGRPYRVYRCRAPVSPHPAARMLQMALMLVCAIGIIRRERIGAIHIGHLYLGPVGLALRSACGMPYVLYLHGGEMALYMRWRIVRRIVCAVARGARCLVMNSTFTRDAYAALGVVHPDTQIATIGVDTERFRPDLDAAAARRRYGLGGERVLLTVGRLVERKGHDAVIRALARVRQAVGPVRYLIVGTGPEEPRLRALAREQGCEADVLFPGRVPDGDLPLLYAACDVFVMPSRVLAQRDGVEGFGIVFLEAGASGKPAVGGRSGGIADAVLDGATGILVDPLDVEALAGALIRLLREPGEAARLGAHGRRRAAVLAAAWRATLRRVWEETGADGRVPADAR